MRVWTLTELFRLTRAELFRLQAEIVNQLPYLPDGSNEHLVALENLRRIRQALTRPQIAPG